MNRAPVLALAHEEHLRFYIDEDFSAVFVPSDPNWRATIAERYSLATKAITVPVPARDAFDRPSWKLGDYDVSERGIGFMKKVE